MSLIISHRRGLMSSIIQDKILVTLDMSTPSTAGFKLTFSGSVYIDFKDGAGIEALTSGVEKTNTYTTPGTYIVEITGDFSTITEFAADDSKITAINGLQLGTVSNFFVQNNIFTSLDLSNVVFSSAAVLLYINANFTNLTMPSSGSINNFQCYFTSLSTINVSGVTISGIFIVRSQATLTSINLGVGNGALTDFRINNTGLPNVDFSVFATSDGVSIQCQSCGWTATEHDNQLINLDATGWINGALNVITGNAARTAASDTAYNNLIANGWTIT
jgi:hypothetical protein